MRKDQQTIPNKVQYATIDFNMRLELIRKVEEDQFTISVAAKLMRIKLSTAKLIVTRYRKTGTVFRRKRELQIKEKRGIQMESQSKRNSEDQHKISEQIRNQEAITEGGSGSEEGLRQMLVYPWVWMCDWSQIPLYSTYCPLPQ